MYDISVKKNIEWKAFWLHDPIFKKQPVIQPVDAKRSKYLRTEVQNRHTLFRGEIKNIPIKVQNCISQRMTVTKPISTVSFGIRSRSGMAFAYNYNAFEIKTSEAGPILFLSCFLPGYA